VVICACSIARLPHLLRAVRSVQAQTWPADDVVVVVDHNPELLRRAQACLAPARVLASTAPPGLAGARNTGVAQTTTEIVAFLDDDACAEPDWLRCLILGFRDQAVMGVGGWVKPAWEADPVRWLAPELYWVAGCSYRGLPGPGAPLRNAIGANMAFRRANLVAIGGFASGVGQRPGTELRDDDTDLGIRLQARFPDERLVHLPGARVHHLVPGTRSTWGYLIRRCWGEGRAKARLTQRFGPGSALASERAYMARALPAGVLRGGLEAMRGDPAGLGRAMSILVALTITIAGYGFEWLSFAHRGRP